MSTTTTTTTEEPQVEGFHLNEFLDTLGLSRAERLRADKVYRNETGVKTLKEWEKLHKESTKSKSTTK